MRRVEERCLVGSIPIAYRHIRRSRYCERYAHRAECTQTDWSASVRNFVFLLALFTASPAYAETTVRGFLEEYGKATDDGKRLLDSFLSGLIAAYGWSNITLKTEGLPPHFCPTARLGKEIENRSASFVGWPVRTPRRWTLPSVQRF